MFGLEFSCLYEAETWTLNQTLGMSEWVSEWVEFDVTINTLLVISEKNGSLWNVDTEKNGKDQLAW